MSKPSRFSFARSLRIGLVAVFIVVALCLVLRRQLVVMVAQRAFATPQTVLFVGTNGKLADTVIVGYFGKEKGAPPRLLVISRDAEVNGRKINSYWPEGEAKFKKRIEGIMGHPIANYVAIPFEKMPQLLDKALPDGLSVDVPYRLKRSDSKQGYSFDVAKGRQTLNTHDLMALLRDRYSSPRSDGQDGEASRVRNWKRFFVEFRNEYQKPSSLARISSVAATARQIIKTDLTSNELGGVLTNFVATEFSTDYLPISSRYDEGQHRWITTLDARAARTQAQLLLKGVTIPAKTRVFVLNATNDAGLSRRYAARLNRDMGVATSTGNAAPGAPMRRSTVEFSQPNLEFLATEISDALQEQSGSDRIAVYQAHDDARTPVIVVTLGTDAVKR